MRRRLVVATTWGTLLRPGDSVLEFGCGDGYLAQLFVRYGLRYFGADVSPKMTIVARRRLRESGLKGDFIVADVNQISLAEPFDAVVAYMRSFFSYVPDPLAVLTKIRPYVRKKIVLDFNPRGTLPLETATAIMRRAGFQNVAWRPFFVPKARRLPAEILRIMVLCEDIPLLQSLPLRWKFHIILKGEV